MGEIIWGFGTELSSKEVVRENMKQRERQITYIPAM